MPSPRIPPSPREAPRIFHSTLRTVGSALQCVEAALAALQRERGAVRP